MSNVTEHEFYGSFESPTGQLTRICHCGFMVLGDTVHDVEIDVQVHLAQYPKITAAIETSLAFLETAGHDTSEFIQRWTEPQRVYHGMAHVGQMLNAMYDIEQKYPLCSLDLEILHLSAWYHDIVYVPGSKTNEQDSANLAIRDLDSATATPVAYITLSTKMHLHPHGFLGALVIDADLQGLGASPSIYKNNSYKVKAEYGKITDEQWVAGRVAFLEGFLARKTIYYSSWGAQYEDQARANMQAELEALRSRSL